MSDIEWSDWVRGIDEHFHTENYSRKTRVGNEIISVFVFEDESEWFTVVRFGDLFMDLQIAQGAMNLEEAKAAGMQIAERWIRGGQ